MVHPTVKIQLVGEKMSGSSYITLTLAPGADFLAAIGTAISSLPPSGGCIDARGISGLQVQAHPNTITVSKPVTLLLGPVHIQAIASPTFRVTPQPSASSNNPTTLTVIGLDPTATIIEAFQPGMTLFQLAGDFLFNFDTLDGTPTFAIKRCQLFGGNQPGVPPLVRAGTVMLDTQAIGVTNFQDGLILIEDNLVSGFGDTAVKVGASVYFTRIHRNGFLNNNKAVYLDNNTEASITENYFAQGANGGPTLTLIGPMHRVVHNYFTRHILSDPSIEPDILLQPQAGWQDAAGGYVWIVDNRFMGERENLDTRRRRITLTNSQGPQLVAGPTILRGNQFFGPAATGTVTASGTVATFTLDFNNSGYCTQGLVANQSVVTITNPNAALGEYPIYGTFVVDSIINTGSVTPTAPQAFTYTLPTPTTPPSGIGPLIVRLAEHTKPVPPAAIELDSAHLPWDVQGNYFVYYAVLINDNQCPPGQPQATGFEWGQSLFADNRVSCPPGGYRVFQNEGNDFTSIRPPANSSTEPLDPWPRQNESLTLRNRLPQSESLGSWQNINGLTVSPQGQPDPFGTNRARLLSLNGTSLNQSLQSAAIDLSGVSSTGRLVIKFWAKQDSLASLGVSLFDVTQQAFFGNYFSVSLSPTWKQYKFVTNQLYSLTDIFTLIFYPGDPTFTNGTVYLFAPQVSDDDSDYYPTGASVLADPSAGSRFEKAVVLTSLKTATHTGDSSSAPKATWTGLGPTGTVNLTGCTDMSGVLVLTPDANGTTAGTVTLQYNVPYTGVSPPVVVASLQYGSQPWVLGASQVCVVSSSQASCTIAWENRVPLKNPGTYGIAYIVIGRS